MNGLRVADIFCGPGGLSEGMRLGRFEVIYGVDKAKDAVDTFRINHPEAKAQIADVRDFNTNDIPDFDVLVGGPPCVNFSQSKGGRANILEGLELVQFYLRLVYERKPKYWIMENVPRIALHLPESFPLKWIGIEKRGELHVPVRQEFNCANFGAPQNRKRSHRPKAALINYILATATRDLADLYKKGCLSRNLPMSILLHSWRNTVYTSYSQDLFEQSHKLA